MNRKLTGSIGIVLCGIALGAVVAYVVAYAIQLREGRTELREYAGRLITGADQLAVEDIQAIELVSHDNLLFCSDQELAFMRDYVYKAPRIRDLGRTKDGLIYCTASIGRLPEPQKMPAPDDTYRGLQNFVHVPLMISRQSTGFMVEGHGVTVVISPTAIASLGEPPKYYSSMLCDRPTRRMIHTSGPPIPLSWDEVVGSRLIQRNGNFYQPQCSKLTVVCRVAIESRADILARGRSLRTGSLIVGAILGGALGLMLMQFYEGQRSMESQLRRAIHKGLLTMVYQPIVDLDTLTIVGAEALVRWVNEAGESVRPDIFVALAEERGFVGEITKLVMKTVAEEMGDLLAAGGFRVTINIASDDLTDPSFFRHLERCMAAGKIQPSAFGLELTERSTADHKTIIKSLALLRSLGHTMYIDDFGTGYSNLAYLHELRVDAIKVDRAFTQTVGTDAVTASVVPQILAMAAKLDLLVVVEGIETEEQAQYFRVAGRGILGQGWLYGKPVPIAQFRRLVQV